MMLLLLPTLLLFLLNTFPHTTEAASRTDGRYSYSLTTFDPEGRLGQVERAAQAARFGVPLIAAVVSNDKDDKTPSIIMAAPQRLPSPFMLDDGTARWARLTPQLLVAHTGLAADGRALIAAAQRLAVQHEFTYNQNLPVDLCLEELALLLQQYTRQPAARPLGVTLLVAYVPGAGEEEEDGMATTSSSSPPRPRLFQVDPSGAVSEVGPVVMINCNNNNNNEALTEFLDHLSSNGKQSQDSGSDNDKAKNDNNDVESQLAALLRKALEEPRHDDIGETETEDKDNTTRAPSSSCLTPKTTILTARLSPTKGFSLRRHDE